MTTITTQEAKTHLARYLAEVEQGKEYVIARGKKAVARLVPMEPARQITRPKVGDIEGEPFVFPDSAFAPMTESESEANPVVPLGSGNPAPRKPRPKVGETMDAPFTVPDSAFAPLTDAELKEWGL